MVLENVATQNRTPIDQTLYKYPTVSNCYEEVLPYGPGLAT